MQTKLEKSGTTLLLLVSALLWSSGGLLIKIVDATPMAISAGRSIIAAFTLMLLTGRAPLKPSIGILTCAFFYSCTVVSFVIATRLTSAANAIVLQYTAPIYVALLSSYFLGEKTTKLDWLTILVVLGGMVLFFGDKIGPGNSSGNVIAIFSGISFAAMVVSLRKIRANHPADAIIWGNLLAFLLGVPWLGELNPSFSSMLGIIFLGVFQLGVSYYLYTKAITQASALQAVLIPVVEPLLNPVWVYLVIGEAPSSMALMGAAIILTAITLRGIVR